MSVNVRWWRQWHRWIAFPAAAFLVFASVTGVLTAWYEFFGAEEALREATRDLVSPVTTTSPADDVIAPIVRALRSASTEHAGAPVDKIEVQFKGDQPTVTLFTGRPAGGEDQRLVFDATTGTLLEATSYSDKPLIHRIHSGEFFGDGGLVLAMVWGLALFLLSISGFTIYLTMRRPGRTGIRRVFW